jgi:four helix bundle protein
MNQRLDFHQRCARFAAAVLRLLARLPKDAIAKHVSDQLMRSATSVGANVQEAQAGQSRADSIHKMQIALKEAREAGYWLTLLHEGEILHDASLPSLESECRQIAAILASSVITAKSNALR